MSTVTTRIVPGSVNNNGINDKSIPDYAVKVPTTPLHAPVIHAITPRGKLASEKGTVWIDLADFESKFGSISDPKSPFYNPTSVLIDVLKAGRQATIGVRRLSANKKVARVALSAFVQMLEIPRYERDLAGFFKYDANGDKIPTGATVTGLNIVIKPDPEAANVEPGALQRRTIAGTPASGGNPAIPDTQVFPLFEALAGVGDFYNNCGLKAGVQNNTMNYRNIAEFVKDTGVFPFDLQTFIDNASGTRTFAKTPRRKMTVPFTLFPVTHKTVDYGLKQAFGEFTGTNVNRQVTPTEAPFESVFTYDENIMALCMAMYAVEQPLNNTLVAVSDLPYQQMNPFTCTNHNGAPYHGITGSNTIVWDLSGAVKAQYGISPFLTDEGELPEYVTQPVVYDPFNLLTNVNLPLSVAQGWQITNQLMVDDLIEYLDGIENQNYIRNRHSTFWDVGYTQAVKDQAKKLLNARKDIKVVLDAMVWNPNGEANSLDTLYSRFATLTNALRMFPESDKWGTGTCRAAINLIQAKVIGEATGGYFSGNLDLAYAFALYAGNRNGTVRTAFSPDSGDNRILRVMHSPYVEFEDNYTGADNFDGGGITLRPYDTERFFRPALPTVYSNPDSVLKDLVTNFLCVSIEKICQDMWNTVCGDTTLSAANYVSLFKDRTQRKCRDSLGGQARQIVVSPSYDETVVGGRAVMNTIVHAYFNKGKYMMELDLFAYNEEDLADSSSTAGSSGSSSVSSGSAVNP